MPLVFIRISRTEPKERGDWLPSHPGADAVKAWIQERHLCFLALLRLVKTAHQQQDSNSHCTAHWCNLESSVASRNGKYCRSCLQHCVLTASHLMCLLEVQVHFQVNSSVCLRGVRSCWPTHIHCIYCCPVPIWVVSKLVFGNKSMLCYWNIWWETVATHYCLHLMVLHGCCGPIPHTPPECKSQDTRCGLICTLKK